MPIFTLLTIMVNVLSQWNEKGKHIILMPATLFPLIRRWWYLVSCFLQWKTRKKWQTQAYS